MTCTRARNFCPVKGVRLLDSISGIGVKSFVESLGEQKISQVHLSLRWARRSRSPESTLWRRLFERSEFLFGAEAEGTRKRMIKTSVSGVLGPLPCSRTYVYAARAKVPAALLTNVLIILCRAAHGRKWFWSLLPKQKGLVARGRNPASQTTCEEI